MGCKSTIRSCDDDVGGVYAAPSGERWIVLDNGPALELYPLFPDAPSSPDIVIAPRVIDLHRAGGPTLAGETKRRYMLRALACDGRAPASITRCAGDALDVVVADPSPPTSFEPCAFEAPRTRVERWRRE
jgi:hypothetical protein